MEEDLKHWKNVKQWRQYSLFIPFVINIWYTTTTKWESRNCTQKPIVSVDDIWHSELQLDEVNTDKVSLNKHFKFHHLVVAYQPVWRHLFISFLTVSQPEEGSTFPLSFLDQCFMEKLASALPPESLLMELYPQHRWWHQLSLGSFQEMSLLWFKAHNYCP